MKAPSISACRFACVILCLTFLHFLSAQHPKKDSLFAALRTAKNDTNRIKTLVALAQEYHSSNPDTSIILSRQALALADMPASRAGKKFMSHILGQLGTSYFYKSDYTEALDYFLSALKATEESKDKVGMAQYLGSIGIIYKERGNYAEALAYYLKALKLAEEIDNKYLINIWLSNLGVVYHEMNDTRKALDYYSRSLKMAEQTGNLQMQSTNLANIGVLQTETGNYGPALESCLRSLAIDEKQNNKNNISRNLDRIGEIYKNQKDYVKALDYYTKALKIAEEIGDKSHLAILLDNIGVLYLAQQNDKKGEDYILRSIAMAEEVGSPEDVRLACENLSGYYARTNRYKEALAYYRKAMALKDTLFNEAKNKEIVQQEMTYKFEKKEALARVEQAKKDVIAAAALNQQKQQRNYSVIGLVLVLLFAIFIFRSYRQKQKVNVLIARQKEEVEKQKHLVEQKHKEIKDSINYAERIQRSFLASEELLGKNLNDYFVLFRPKDVVSGDFYWAHKLADGRFAVAVADSTGHGVPGAIMSILNISCLEKAVEEKQLSEPYEILNHTRLKIIERLKKDGSPEGGRDGMDCSLLSFDFANSALTFAAAHIPVWIVRGNDILEFSADKMPVGKHDRDTVPFNQQTVKLQKGDMIYSTTDGMPDQFGGPDGKKFMRRQLKELLVSIADLPVLEQKQKLAQSLDNWKAGREQVDDVCVIGIRF